MKEVSRDGLHNTAHDLSSHDLPWHFHMLPLNCQLNNSGKYAVVLEAEGHETLVVYSDKPELALEQALLQLPHGKQIIDDEVKIVKSEEQLASEKLATILTRIKELSEQKIVWHFHMLNPYCQYNRHLGKWTILFEESQTNETRENVYEDEPKSDFKQIEKLFNRQEKTQ